MGSDVYPSPLVSGVLHAVCPRRSSTGIASHLHSGAACMLIIMRST